MQHPLGVGILGAGTIGGTLIRRLIDEHDVVRVKTGLDLEVRRVAVRSLDKARAFTLPDGVLSDRPDELVTADDYRSSPGHPCVRSLIVSSFLQY